jgi:hypothetical protein
MLFMASFVFANVYCPGYSCSNQYYLGQYQKPAFGSYAPAYTDFTPYQECITENSLYDPVAADLDADGEMEYIIFPSLTRMVVYNSRCVVEDTRIFDASVMSSAAIIDSGRTTDDYEIMLLTNRSLLMLNSSSLATIATLNGSFENMRNFGCDRYFCFARNATSRYTIFSLFDNYDATSNLAMTVSYASGVISTINTKPDPSTQGVAVHTDTVNEISSVLYCGVPSGSNTQGWCHDIHSDNSIGAGIATFTGSGTVDDVFQTQAQRVDMDGANRIIIFTVGQKGSVNVSIRLVTDDAYTVLRSNSAVCGNATTASYQCVNSTNWMIADYDKDGYQEACIMVEGNSRLICFDNQFLTAKYNISVSGINPISHYMFMADVNSSKPFMHIMDKVGIYYPAQNLTLYNNTRTIGITDTRLISVLNNDRTAILPVFHFTGTPQMYYVSGTESLMILQNGSITTSCGDGVCTQGENFFSCPADCSTTVITDGSCSSDQDCYIPGYPYTDCWQGQCVAGLSDLACTDNSDCPYNASLCFANRCVQAVSNLTGYTLDGLDENQRAVRHWADFILGKSAFLKMFFGIMLTLFLAIFGYVFIAMFHAMFGIRQAPHMIFPVLGAILGLIMSTAFGLFPIWVIVLFVLVSIGVFLMFKYMIAPTGGTG